MSRRRTPQPALPRLAIVLLVVLLVAAGLLYFLSANVEEVPLTVIEENVVSNDTN